MFALLLCLTVFDPGHALARPAAGVAWGNALVRADEGAKRPLVLTPRTRYTVDGRSCSRPEAWSGLEVILHYHRRTGEVYWAEFLTPKGKE